MTVKDVLKLVVILALAPATVATNACALSMLWQWYVTETFGVVAINWAQAFGLIMIAGLPLMYYGADHDYKDAGLPKLIARLVVAPSVTAGIGWLVRAIWLKG